MNDDELKLCEDLQAVINANKKVNDAEICFVLRKLVADFSPVCELCPGCGEITGCNGSCVLPDSETSA